MFCAEEALRLVSVGSMEGRESVTREGEGELLRGVAEKG